MTRARLAYDAWHRGQEADPDGEGPWHRMLEPFLGDLGARRVLEVACGRGGFALRLATQTGDRRPAEVIGVDFSDVAIERARATALERRAPNLSYRVGDATALEWPDRSFDAVISCETIEHVDDPPRAVREFGRVLRPGGRLYLTCPSYANLMGLYRLYLPLTGRRFTEGGQPVSHCLVAPRVWRWVAAAGLLIERRAGSGHYVPFPRRSPIRVRALDRFELLSRYCALHTLVVARRMRG